jgi:hypothetical protein
MLQAQTLAVGRVQRKCHIRREGFQLLRVKLNVVKYCHSQKDRDLIRAFALYVFDRVASGLSEVSTCLNRHIGSGVKTVAPQLGKEASSHHSRPYCSVI